MRHFLSAALSISLLAIRMGVPALAAPLAPEPAVAMAAVAVTAKVEDLPAQAAGDEPQRFQAPPARARGSGPPAWSVRSRCRWIAGALLIRPGLGASTPGPTFSPCRPLATACRPLRPVSGRSRARRPKVQNHAVSGEHQHIRS